MTTEFPKSIDRRIEGCLQLHRYNLHMRLKQIKKDAKKGIDVASQLEKLGREIGESEQQCRRRRASLPQFDYADLPIAERRESITELIRENQAVILCGETGSGKTTQLPKICLDAGRGISGMIGHTQPRRIAARTVARRIAQELGCETGTLVGHQVRFEDNSGPETLIKLMTDGILLAEIQADPYLNRYDTLIIDEAHERSLNIDFLLGYLKWLLSRRPDLKLIVTSATIDSDRFSAHFDGAPVIEVSGRAFPVEVRYREVEPDSAAAGGSTDLQQGLLEAVDELAADTGGDILIFLPGEREIREAADLLRKRHANRWDILPLYSRLSAGQQERVFQPHGGRRIVLATNVAETSLTVPGIRSVIDTGTVRISRYSYRSKIQRLPVEPVSRASADQRAGRCGRLGPGICIRLYSEDDFLSREEFTDPEIRRTNLASVILQMKSLRLGKIEEFPFIDPPDSRAIRDGVKLLHELQALDRKQKMTSIGRQLVRMPVDPRLGRMVIAAADEKSLTEVSVIVAGLSIQDPRERPAEASLAADEKHNVFRDRESDFRSLLNLWSAFEEKRAELSTSKLRKYCLQNFLSFRRMKEWREIHTQLLQFIRKEPRFRLNQQDAEYGQIHRALLAGLISNIGFRQEGSEYLGARNLKFHIHPGSGLFQVRPKWIVVFEQVETSRVYARNVALIRPEWVEPLAPQLVKLSHFEPHWERKPSRVAVYERCSIYGIVLQGRRRIPYERIDPAGAREIFIRAALVSLDYNSKAPFFEHNRDLLDSMGYLQHKGRRADILADEEVLYRFFDDRLPATVVDGNSFERWRRQAERDNPGFLRLSEKDVVSGSGIDESLYPDTLDVADTTLSLEYHFSPGDERDGVTVLVPLHCLTRLKSGYFESVVPGLLAEKTVHLIRCLPKSIRRNFVPVQEYADRFLEEVELSPGVELYRPLAKWLCARRPVSIDADFWSSLDLPDHLSMNYRVLGEGNEVLGEGRDLEALKSALAEQARAGFQSAVAEDFRKSGCSRWDFGDLEASPVAASVGFAGLVDEGGSVGLTVYETRLLADAGHHFGVARLFVLVLGKELKYIAKLFRKVAPEAVTYSGLGKNPRAFPAALCRCGDFYDDFLVSLIASVFLESRPKILNATDFEKRLKECRPALVEIAEKNIELLVQIMEAARRLRPARENGALPAEIQQDISEQLSLLIFRGFLAHVPSAALDAYPRYLKALLYRLEKAREDPARDRARLAELQPVWERYWQWVDSAEPGYRAATDDFRWRLEELRISLFAQVIKARGPVSVKRLDKVWEQRL